MFCDGDCWFVSVVVQRCCWVVRWSCWYSVSDQCQSQARLTVVSDMSCHCLMFCDGDCWFVSVVVQHCSWVVRWSCWYTVSDQCQSQVRLAVICHSSASSKLCDLLANKPRAPYNTSTVQGSECGTTADVCRWFTDSAWISGVATDSATAVHFTHCTLCLHWHSWPGHCWLAASAIS